MAAKHSTYRFDSRNPPDFDADRVEFRNLIRGPREYSVQLNEIADRTRKIFELNLDDVARQTSEEFVSKLETNFVRYVTMLAEVIDEALPDTTDDESKWDRIDVLMKTRERIQEQRDDDDTTENSGKLPKDLTRRFEISVTPRVGLPSLAVREVTAEHIGRLVTVTGLVTRVSSVKPLVFVAAYVCDACGYESYQSVRSTQFMPLLECSAPQCRAATKQARMHLQTRTSRFLKHQELTVQESPDQVPVGAIPRSMRVLVRGESVRQCHAGEKVSVTGVKIPLQKSGFRAMKAGLTTDTTFDAILIRKSKPGYDEEVEDEDEYDEAVQEMAESRDCYDRLSESIAPEIFGLKDLKKALLLLMVGGVTKRMQDGLTIRGDINLILMGDPGVAKSQLLKHICTIAPRAIYTTGKGSSGAGLTAAVMRDPVTDEMVLEGGALVLADMGIAAIDEFDKMEDSDRTAIHEVMEQQTISISKAGICTTLNARASILAAANPVFGRYDKRKTPEENIELPAALMSRFDLMFIMVDKPSRSDDEELARHICHVHQHLRPVQHELHLQSPAFLRAYIKKARTFDPSIPRELTQHVVGTYIQARSEGRQSGARRLLPTPRTLLSVLRLSQALARLRFSNVVSEADIEEATRLWQESRASMLDDDDEEMVQRRQDIVTQIYTAIKDYMNKRGLQSTKLTDVMNHLHSKGYLEQNIEDTFEKYEAMDVMFRNPQRTKLSLVHTAA